jgi:IPT/TIG domain/S-layer homology domain
MPTSPVPSRALVSALLLLTVGLPLGAATFTVTNTNDSGAGSFRQAILGANANPGLDTIAFDIPGAGVHTITPSSNLDAITDPVIVDGYTQPGSSVNTDPVGTNAVLLIELDGSVVGGGFSNGLNLTAGGNTVQGLVVNRWAVGIHTFGVGGNVIRGNFTGTDPTGTFAQPNGVAIQINAPNDLVGGGTPADRNLVSGNTAGTFDGAIEFGIGPGSAGAAQGNLIGTDATGMLAIPNADGIYANGAVTIGGSISGTGNVISGNSLDGLFIQGAVVIQGNKIGTTADGTGALGNGSSGINIHETNDATIGGAGAGDGNVIAYNGVSGIRISSSGQRNSIRGNSMFRNGIAIDLNEDGPTPNDPGDAENGANGLQNFPIIQSVTTGASTHILGKFNSAPSTTFDIDFFADPACSNFPRELLQGKTYLGFSQVTTDGSGNAAIDVTLPVATEVGARITTTATDPNDNTSELSQRIIFSIGPSSGPSSGGTSISVAGTDFADPTTLTFGGTAATVTFVDDHSLNTTSPPLPPGTVNDVVATTPDGTTGTLVKGWVSDFLDVPNSHQFYSFVTTLVSNAITVGVGGGLYGVDQSTLRQQMAVFLLKAKHGLCYTPPPCQGDFGDVPCPSTFADWIEALADEGITGGCGNGNFCPGNPVRRDQMAPFLLKAEHGSSYSPPACTGTFDDVACPSLFADWIEQLATEQITGGCGGGNYCPLSNSTRGQMAVFVVKTFHLQ